MKQKVIICVDDEQIVLTSLRSVLRRNLGKEYELEFVESGQEALDLIEDLGPDSDVSVIISDWLMPAMRGDELLTRVKHMNPEVKAIVLSGQVDEHAIQSALLERYVDYYIEKPWEEEKLINCILSEMR